jgi:perosamine synthetase
MGFRIPVADVFVTEEEAQAVYDAVMSGWLSQGPRVAEFEEEFARYVGCRHAIAVNNGTSALHLALAAAGIGEGDEVIVPPLTFISTANVILFQNASVVLADIDPQTLNINVDEVRRKISSRTKAVIPVHLFGQPADMDPLMEVCEEENILVIEDAAEAHGATYKERMAGTLGHAACFSFFPNKNMTTGEGGMVTTNDDELAEDMRVYRNQGQRGRYNHVVLGFNYRMTEMQAVLGIVQLKRLEWVLERKKKIAEVYDELLEGLPGVEKPFIEGYTTRHAYYFYTLLFKNYDRDKVAAFLENRGVETRVSFPPIHIQPYYRERFGYKPLDYPKSYEAYTQLLNIPSHPKLTIEEQEYIMENIKTAI